MAIDRDAPLGVFDSGLGGLTVVHQLREQLPGEDIVYLGDTARVPYGTRSAATVVRYARGCARLLTERGVKMLVIACNTASAVSLDILRAELDIPVIGVVEPGARAAIERAEAAGVQRIGVLGTASTVASGAYPKAVAMLSTRVEVEAKAAPLLVPLVEEGWLEGDVPELALERYLTPLVDAGVGVIVLGCTHYPLLKGGVARVAHRLAGRPVSIVDSAHAVAAEVATLLHERSLGSDRASGQLELLVTDLPQSFSTAASRFLGEQLPEARLVDITVSSA